MQASKSAPRATLVSLLLALAVSAASACGGGRGGDAEDARAAGEDAVGEAPGDAPAPEGWKRVEESGGGFSVLLPEDATRKASDAGGARFVLWMGKSRNGAAYSAASIRVGEGESSDEEVVRSFVDGLAKGCGGKLEGLEAAEVDGREGFRFRAACKKGPLAGFARRLGRRVVAAFVLGGADAAPAAEVERFLASFEPSEAAAPPSE